MPFCERRCDYCAFATWTDRHHLMQEYVRACTTEMARAYRGGLSPAATVYVGGGTPSLLPPAMLAELLGGVERVAGAEITVECNPESTTRELLHCLRDAGVTRISLGVQSLQAHVLDGLGRHQEPGSVARAVALLGDAGFPSYSVDLIYGGAGETDADWLATLDAVLRLEPSPPHVSAYALTVEPGTPLAREPSRHPDDDIQADRYALLDDALSKAGLAWYELSNFALPGHECRHNLACWHQEDYRGFGCAAHSHEAGRRWWNVRSVDRYLAAVAAGTPVVAGQEHLGHERRARERLELLLRTSDGVPEAALPDDPAIADLVERRDGRAVLTLRGRLLANEVTARLASDPAGAGAIRLRSVAMSDRR